MPRMAKHVHRERVSGELWIDVEPLRVRDLYIYEDTNGYFAAVKASKRKGVHLYRVVAYLTVGKTIDEILIVLATNRQKAVTTAKKWATEERALLN
jgi:hypothetical protein